MCSCVRAFLKPTQVDQQGHAFGPASDEVTSYLTYVDDFVKSVQEQLEARHLADVVDLIVVSDHGMTSTDNERVVYLDKVLGQDGWDAIEHKEGWPSCGLRFKPGTDGASKSFCFLASVSTLD